MSVKAVIFDLDGVLCRTDEYHYQAWKAIADKIGVAFDRETNHLLRGISRMNSLEIILEEDERNWSEKEKEGLVQEKNLIYRELLHSLSEKDICSNARETLKELRRRNYKLAIGSSSKNTDLILRQLQLIDYFDAVSDGTTVLESKPHPAIFLNAAGQLGCLPEECLVVEDAVSGIIAAHAGGMKAAAIGEISEQGLGDYKLKSLTDLLVMLPEKKEEIWTTGKELSSILA